MTATLVIAAREMRERSFVLLAAACIAVLPFALSLLPGAKRFGTAGFIAFAGGIFASGFALGLALVVGASMVGRELSERRLSFYFARPVSGASIWFGKVIGAVVLTALSFAIIFVPSFLTGRGTWDMSWQIEPMGLAAGVLFLAVLFILNAHALSTVIRSRSPLTAIDFLAAAAIGAVIYSIISTLIWGGAMKLSSAIAGYLLIGGILSLMGAGAWQLSRGRAEVRRSHAAMSQFLWLAFGSLVLLAGAYTLWVVNADPEDLEDPTAIQSPQGHRVLIAGMSPLRGDYYSAFLLDTQTGEATRFPVARWGFTQFSRSGDAVLLESRQQEMMVMRFGKDPEPLETGILRAESAVISDDLERIAVLQGDTVSIRDLDSDRIEASGAIPKTSVSGAFLYFLSPDVLRIIRRHSKKDVQEIHIYELNAATRTLARTGQWSGSGTGLRVQVSDDGSALLVTRVGGEEGPRVFLFDGRTSEVKSVLPVEAAPWWGARLLRDGTIAVITPGPDRTLKVLSAGGALVRAIPLGRANRVRIVNATASGKLIIAMTNAAHETTASDWSTIVVDPARGTIVRRDEGLLLAEQWWSTDPRTPAPNATGDFIVTDANGDLWRWNADTGKKTKLLS